MKIKVNLEKETISIKGLTPLQFSLIEALLSHVRLGDSTNASEAAFEILNAIEQAEDLDFIEQVEIDIGATTDGQIDGLELWMTTPTLVACEVEEDADFGEEDDFDPFVVAFVQSKSSCSNGDCSECDCDD